jgi:hypothetical protein
MGVPWRRSALLAKLLATRSHTGGGVVEVQVVTLGPHHFVVRQGFTHDGGGGAFELDLASDLLVVRGEGHGGEGCDDLLWYLEGPGVVITACAGESRAVDKGPRIDVHEDQNDLRSILPDHHDVLAGELDWCLVLYVGAGGLGSRLVGVAVSEGEDEKDRKCMHGKNLHVVASLSFRQLNLSYFHCFVNERE